jgi:hypothetical protein
MMLTSLGVLWEKQLGKLEEADCSAGVNVRSRKNIIGKLKEI